MYKLLVFLLLISILYSCSEARFISGTQPVIQKTISRIEKMPNHPRPYAYKDWRQTAIEFDRYVFDFNQQGQYLPLIWLDGAKRNFPDTTFGFYTAIGDIRMGPNVNNGENHEALGALGSVLGATLVGIDKSNQDGRNYVRMLRNYFNKDNGWNVVMDFTNKGAHIGGGYGNDFWYEIHNNMLFYAVANYYPGEKDFDYILKTIADQFYKSDSIMGDSYSYSYFDFKNMVPGKNHIPTQEDVAGGYAFILYSAWIKYKDPKYLKAAKHAMDILYNQKENRFYEAMLPLAAYIGARMNVEAGTDYDIQRFIDWTFNGDAVGREGWGVIADKWGDYDVSGLAGSTIDHGGYGFLMNTFDLMLPMSALVKYDPRYARAVGKWALNASNAARFCYPYDIPDSLQAIPQHKSITKNLIAYEGLIKESGYPDLKGKSPVAQGDGPQWATGMPPVTMFSVYGSSHVGLFGGTIQKTTVDQILQIDCNKTDMYISHKAFPTYLFYNPYSEVKSIEIDLGDQFTDVYDRISHSFLFKHRKGKISVQIPEDAVRLLVYITGNKKISKTNGLLMKGDRVVDFMK